MDFWLVVGISAEQCQGLVLLEQTGDGQYHKSVASVPPSPEKTTQARLPRGSEKSPLS